MVLHFRVRETIDRVTQRAVEHGFTKSFQQKTDRLMNVHRQIKSSVESTTYNIIGFYDLHFVFILYAGAALFAIFVFLSEIIVNKLLNIASTFLAKHTVEQ